MKTFIIALFAFASCSVFASDIQFEITKKGANITVPEIVYCKAEILGALCISYTPKWKKSVECSTKNGVTTAELNYSNPMERNYAPSFVGPKTFKIKTKKLCSGKKVDSLIFNGVTIF